MDQVSRTGLDTAIRALADVYRRRLLVALLEHDPPGAPVRVPEEVELGERDLDLVQAELFHSHLPHLEDAGFIRWDREAHEVVKGPDFEEIRPLLELMHAHRDELPAGWS